MSDKPNGKASEKPTGPTIEGPEELTDRWPQISPAYRQVYGFRDPQWHVMMVAMTQQTWMDITRNVNNMKKQLDALTEENILLKRGLHPNGPRIVLPN